MKAYILAFVCAGLVAGVVHAEDLCGWHLGVHAGYSSLSPDYTEFAFSNTVFDNGVDDFSGGVLVGYDRGWHDLLVGVEADFAFTHAQQTELERGAAPADVTVFNVDWYSHVRVRISSTDDDWRPFFAAGLALVNMKVTDAFAGNADRKESTLSGWTIGGGVDRPVSHNAVLRFEGLYDHFESDSFRQGSGEGDWRPDAFTGRVALSWHL